MAGSDYFSCSGCGTKTFYDADVEYDERMVIDVASLCPECAKSFEIIVRRKKSKREVPRQDGFN